MNQLKKHKVLFFILLFATLIIVPLFLDYFIFNNTFPSKVSNDGWAGFWGGYLGAIIGAIATLCAILLEITHNQKQRKQDEIKTIRPYLCVQNIKWHTIDGRILNVELEVQNVGFHAACDISIYENNLDCENKKCLYNKHTTLGANNKVIMEIKVNLYESEFYKFCYFDIRGDIYMQELRFATVEKRNIKCIDSCITLEPRLYKTKEEREI